MSNPETRINDALRVLGDEHRMGMVSVEEYRSRRRMLLDSWGERDVTTSPAAIRRADTNTGSRTRPNPAAAAPAAPKPPQPGGRGWLVGGALLALAAAAASFFLLGFGAETPPPARVAAAPAQPSAAVLEVGEAARAFLARNQWDAADLDAFAASWSAVPMAERGAARAEPAVKSLRHELGQNILAERQMHGAEESASSERLQRLEQLARALDGDAL